MAAALYKPDHCAIMRNHSFCSAMPHYMVLVQLWPNATHLVANDK